MSAAREQDTPQEVDLDFGTSFERIDGWATIIRTYDGQRIVVPNSDIYTNAVQVKTAYEKRRSQYDIGIGYGDRGSQREGWPSPHEGSPPPRWKVQEKVQREAQEKVPSDRPT